MKLPRLNFTSYRDTKGYRIIAKIPPPRQRRSLDELLDEPLPAVSSGRLGQVRADGTADGEWISGEIVSNGGKREKVPLEQYLDAFAKFAAVKTPTELLGFVTKFGPLTNAKRQVVIELLAEAQQMRECMRADKAEPFLRNLDLKARLIKDRKTGELDTSVTPSSLLDALWLQFQQSQSSGADFRECVRCGSLFSVGGNSGRLRFAKFCSDEHRKEFNSLARSNPTLREKRNKPRRAFFARHRKSMKGADR
jgi:hypothetical protein